MLTIQFKRPKLYEYRSDVMDQHKANTALLTRSKFVHQTSTYRGGTTEYLNEIELRLPFVKIRKAWMNTEHGELS